MAYNNRTETIEIIYADELQVNYGDTLDGLVYPYWKKCETGISWDEYRHEMKKLNNDLFKDGRALQAKKDVVKVEWYIIRKLEK